MVDEVVTTEKRPVKAKKYTKILESILVLLSYS